MRVTGLQNAIESKLSKWVNEGVDREKVGGSMHNGCQWGSRTVRTRKLGDKLEKQEAVVRE